MKNHETDGGHISRTLQTQSLEESLLSEQESSKLKPTTTGEDDKEHKGMIKEEQSEASGLTKQDRKVDTTTSLSTPGGTGDDGMVTGMEDLSHNTSDDTTRTNGDATPFSSVYEWLLKWQKETIHVLPSYQIVVTRRRVDIPDGKCDKSKIIQTLPEIYSAVTTPLQTYADQYIRVKPTRAHPIITIIGGRDPRNNKDLALPYYDSDINKSDKMADVYAWSIGSSPCSIKSLNDHHVAIQFNGNDGTVKVQDLDSSYGVYIPEPKRCENDQTNYVKLRSGESVCFTINKYNKYSTAQDMEKCANKTIQKATCEHRIYLGSFKAAGGNDETFKINEPEIMKPSKFSTAECSQYPAKKPDTTAQDTHTNCSQTCDSIYIYSGNTIDLKDPIYRTTSGIRIMDNKKMSPSKRKSTINYLQFHRYERPDTPEHEDLFANPAVFKHVESILDICAIDLLERYPSIHNATNPWSAVEFQDPFLNNISKEIIELAHQRNDPKQSVQPSMSDKSTTIRSTFCVPSLVDNILKINHCKEQERCADCVEFCRWVPPSSSNIIVPYQNTSWRSTVEDKTCFVCLECVTSLQEAVQVDCACQRPIHSVCMAKLAKYGMQQRGTKGVEIPSFTLCCGWCTKSFFGKYEQHWARIDTLMSEPAQTVHDHAPVLIGLLTCLIRNIWENWRCQFSTANKIIADIYQLLACAFSNAAIIMKDKVAISNGLGGMSMCFFKLSWQSRGLMPLMLVWSSNEVPKVQLYNVRHMLNIFHQGVQTNHFVIVHGVLPALIHILLRNLKSILPSMEEHIRVEELLLETMGFEMETESEDISSSAPTSTSFSIRNIGKTAQEKKKMRHRYYEVFTFLLNWRMEHMMDCIDAQDIEKEICSWGKKMDQFWQDDTGELKSTSHHWWKKDKEDGDVEFIVNRGVPRWQGISVVQRGVRCTANVFISERFGSVIKKEGIDKHKNESDFPCGKIYEEFLKKQLEKLVERHSDRTCIEPY